MTERYQDFREQILTESIRNLGDENAVALLGILFAYRIVLSEDVSRIVQQRTKTFDLQPLEPQSAADLIASLYDFDSAELFLAFQNDWATLKNSPTVWNLIADMQSHDYVDRLELWPTTP